MQNWFQHVHRFGLDAKIINYVLGFEICFCEGKKFRPKCISYVCLKKKKKQKLFCFLFLAFKIKHCRGPCPMFSAKYLFQEQF